MYKDRHDLKNYHREKRISRLSELFEALRLENQGKEERKLRESS